jgi:hypothetical protein
MANPSLIQTRVVLIADLNSLNINKSISAAILYYKELYGEPRRVWVNPKDYQDDIAEVDGYKIEKRGGCCRGKVMVM